MPFRLATDFFMEYRKCRAPSVVLTHRSLMHLWHFVPLRLLKGFTLLQTEHRKSLDPTFSYFVSPPRLHLAFIPTFFKRLHTGRCATSNCLACLATLCPWD